MYYYGHSAAQIVVDVKYPESFEWRLSNTFINRMLFRSLFIPLSLFFGSLQCLSFHLRFLSTRLCKNYYLDEFHSASPLKQFALHSNTLWWPWTIKCLFLLLYCAVYLSNTRRCIEITIVRNWDEHINYYTTKTATPLWCCVLIYLTENRN